MNTKERVLAIRLINKLEKHTEYNDLIKITIKNTNDISDMSNTGDFHGSGTKQERI